jgi:aldehyde dehydrogenase (NAD+)
MDFAPLIMRQRAYFQTGATRPLAFRRSQLQKLRIAIETREKSFLEALHADLHKSEQEAYGAEIGLSLSELRYALRYLPSWMKPQRRQTPLLAWPARGFIQPEPYGIALIIGPWNYPFQLLISPLVGAMAAGNCIVLKPSELAPETTAVMPQLISAMFPEEYIAIVQGNCDVAKALLREKFDTIFFTGSTKIGRVVMSAAAQQLTPVTLELGGKCPCLVCADAPLDIAARRIVWGKFMNAGQTCVAPDFILVDHRIRDRFLVMLKQAIREFYGDDPHQSPDYGRIINQENFERLTSFLNTGQIIHGGQNDPSDLYLAPTILVGVPNDAPVMQEEIFGPILPVLEFNTLEEALNLLRDRRTPLALYLFTKDRATQEHVLATTRSGGVCLNDTVMHMIGKQLPFGGLGDSGLGAYHGQASFNCFTHWRSVMRCSLIFDPKIRYPPPRISLTLLRRAYRFLLGG